MSKRSYHTSKKALEPLAPDEKWLPVPGYEGVYEVSNYGRVRRVGAKPLMNGGWRS